MSPKKITLPLDIYVRVSDVKGREGDSFISPSEQADRCRSAAAARGLEVGEVLEELNVSGGKMDRPALNEALERIREGVSGGIIVARIDRFGRTVVGALDTIEKINEAGGVVITAEGDFDTSTAVGELVLNMMLSLAQFELRRIRDNWQSAKRRAVERGIHIAPRVPAGYKRNGSKRLEPDGENAETMREAFRMAAAGDSYQHIAVYLNERRLPLWSGEGIWQPNRIRRLLANRVYLGEARSGNGHVNPNAHEALTDEATFLLAQRNPKHGPATSTNPRTMLAGLCRCASCSFSMKAKRHRGDPAGIYRCMTVSGSIHGRCAAPTAITRTNLEEYVLEEFLNRAFVTLEPIEGHGSAEYVDAALRAEQSYRGALTNVELRQQIGDTDHNALVASLHDAWQAALLAIPVPQAAYQSLGTVDLVQLVRDVREAGDVEGLRELLATQIRAVFVRPAASRSRGLPTADRVHIVWADEPELELPKRGTRFEPRQFVWDDE